MTTDRERHMLDNTAPPPQAAGPLPEAIAALTIGPDDKLLIVLADADLQTMTETDGWLRSRLGEGRALVVAGEGIQLAVIRATKAEGATVGQCGDLAWPPTRDGIPPTCHLPCTSAWASWPARPFASSAAGTTPVSTSAFAPLPSHSSSKSTPTPPSTPTMASPTASAPRASSTASSSPSSCGPRWCGAGSSSTCRMPI